MRWPWRAHSPKSHPHPDQGADALIDLDPGEIRAGVTEQSAIEAARQALTPLAALQNVDIQIRRQPDGIAVRLYRAGHGDMPGTEPWRALQTRIQTLVRNAIEATRPNPGWLAQRNPTPPPPPHPTLPCTRLCRSHLPHPTRRPHRTGPPRPIRRNPPPPPHHLTRPRPTTRPKPTNGRRHRRPDPPPRLHPPHRPTHHRHRRHPPLRQLRRNPRRPRNRAPPRPRPRHPQHRRHQARPRRRHPPRPRHHRPHPPPR